MSALRLCALAALLSAASACAQQTERPCSACGGFYPENPAQLRQLVSELYSKATVVKPVHGLAALLVPHAGYYYSGLTAAYGYAAADDTYDVVAVIGPGHSSRLTKAALNNAVYKTPLGNIATDTPLISALLRKDTLFEFNPYAHASEHSIEVQLPLLLARMKKTFTLVPVLLNSSGLDNAVAVGKALGAALKGRKALVIVSTDLSHYPSADSARAADAAMIEALKTLNPSYVALTAKELESRKVKNLDVAACGLEAIAAGLAAAAELGANSAQLLRYSNAGDIPGVEPEKVVGYASMAFFKSESPAKQEFSLTAAQKQYLLQAARQSIREGMRGTPLSPSPLSPAPQFNLPAAVFVTITDGGRLRGCIGTTEPLGPLLDSVRYYARLAAFEDPRFEPLREPELEKVKIEISVLSRPQQVSSAEKIRPGLHGVLLQRHGKRGLFLPQVWKQLPEKEKFLNSLCTEKAGLEASCWKTADTSLYTFTDYAFSE